MNKLCVLTVSIVVLMLIGFIGYQIYLIKFEIDLDISIRYLRNCTYDIQEVLAAEKCHYLEYKKLISESQNIIGILTNLRIDMTKYHKYSAGQTYYLFDKYFKLVFEPFFADVYKLLEESDDFNNEYYKDSIKLLKSRNQDDLAYIERFQKRYRVKESWRCQCEYIDELSISIKNLKEKLNARDME